MWVIGLTGALGAGKSTLSKHCQALGFPIHCADRAIHTLLASDPDVSQQIYSLWPSVFNKGSVDRFLLGGLVQSSPEFLPKLESILYPKLAALQKDFLDCQNENGAPLVILDVPLLLEVGLAPYCHSIILAVAPKSLREERVLGRPGMSKEKFDFFEANRMSDDLRLPLAHTIISTGRPDVDSLRALEETLEKFSKESSPPWCGNWPSTLERLTW